MIKIIGNHEKQTIDQMEVVMKKLNPSYVVLCADAHLGYSVPVGGGDLDESPYFYKRIKEVLEAHKDSIDILHVLNPIGVCMACSK